MSDVTFLSLASESVSLKTESAPLHHIHCLHYVRWRLVVNWWIANMQSYLWVPKASCHYNEEEINRDLEKREDIGRSKLMATWLQPVKSWKTARSCEGADFSWLSSKVSRTMHTSPSDGRWGPARGTQCVMQRRMDCGGGPHRPLWFGGAQPLGPTKVEVY